MFIEKKCHPNIVIKKLFMPYAGLSTRVFKDIGPSERPSRARRVVTGREQLAPARDGAQQAGPVCKRS